MDAGHRALPHTADIRLEAWGPTLGECLAQAVAAMVESFLDPGQATPSAEHELRIPPTSPEDGLVTVLDEVVYLLDTAGQVPVAVTTTEDGDDLLVRFALADVADMPQIGAVPKAVALQDLTVRREAGRWVCAVTLDV